VHRNILTLRQTRRSDCAPISSGWRRKADKFRARRHFAFVPMGDGGDRLDGGQLWAKRRNTGGEQMFSALLLPAQPVDATQALNLSAGVSNCKVSRGRSLS